jgi:HSP20 family protein
MSDDNQVQSRNTISITLIVLLLLVVSVLAWYTFKLQKQLDQVDEQQTVIQSQLQAQTQATAPVPEPVPVPAPVSETEPEPAPVPETSSNDMVVAGSGDSAKVLNATEKQPSESQQDEQDPSSAQLQEQGQGQGENGTSDDKAPFSDDDFYRRPLDTPRWDPYAEIERMQRDMDRMLDHQFKQFQNDPYFQHHFRQSTSSPKINVQENEHQYMIFVNLPGNDEKDISVTLDGQRLTITGKQNYKQQKRDQMGNVIFQERRSGRFQRSITLPEPVYQNEMKTRLDNGILKIKIPKVNIGQRR